MRELRHIEEHVDKHGRVNGHELEEMRQLLYADGKIDRKEANFLVELHKRVKNRTRAFEQFFYKALKDHILTDGKINARKTAWLQDALVSDGKIDDETRKFLHQLKGEATQVHPDFEKLIRKVMKQPPEQRTSGG
jgi:hypothetical protein